MPTFIFHCDYATDPFIFVLTTSNFLPPESKASLGHSDTFSLCNRSYDNLNNDHQVAIPSYASPNLNIHLLFSPLTPPPRTAQSIIISTDGATGLPRHRCIHPSRPRVPVSSDDLWPRSSSSPTRCDATSNVGSSTLSTRLLCDMHCVCKKCPVKLDCHPRRLTYSFRFPKTQKQKIANL